MKWVCSFSRFTLAAVLVWMAATPASAEPVALPGDNVLAMHHGRPHGGRHERHGMHHGMGRGGQGICPQTRQIVQAPEKFQKLKNPLEPSRDNILEGENLFHYKAEPTKCKVCHGPTGNGLGMMAQSVGAMPRNFTCSETMKDIPDGQLFWIIKNGSQGSGMPPFKLFLTDKQVWQLIYYIRTLADQRGTGSPSGPASGSGCCGGRGN